MILSAVYMLWMFQRVNYGPIRNEHNRTLPDLTPREWAMIVPIVALAIFMGVYAEPVPAADGAVRQARHRARSASAGAGAAAHAAEHGRR